MLLLEAVRQTVGQICFRSPLPFLFRLCDCALVPCMHVCVCVCLCWPLKAASATNSLSLASLEPPLPIQQQQRQQQQQAVAHSRRPAKVFCAAAAAALIKVAAIRWNRITHTSHYRIVEAAIRADD